MRISLTTTTSLWISLLLVQSAHGFATASLASTTANNNRRQSPLSSSVSSAPPSSVVNGPPPARLPTSDNVDQFSADIATVLNELRSDPIDPTVPKLFTKTKLPHFSKTFTLRDWARHNSRWRYVDYLVSFPTSRLDVRLYPQMAVLTAWSCLACWLIHQEKLTFFTKLSLGLTPLSLVSTFVAALISLRTNAGLARLNEGRLAFGQVVLYTRDMASLIVNNILPVDRALGLKLLRHVALFGWLLKGFLRGVEVNGTDEDIVSTMLDAPDTAYVQRQRKPPVAVVARLRQAIAYLSRTGKLGSAEHKSLEACTSSLNDCIMRTERIRAGPIPPLYTMHTGRLLMFYLFSLPLALRGTNLLNSVGTVLTTISVGYAMFGLDEISHVLEQPFRLMPLYQLSKNSMKDVADALVCEPPPLDGTAKEEETAWVQPPYWDETDATRKRF